MTSSQVKTVLIIYVINILFSFASLVYVIKNAQLGQIIYIVLFILVIWIVLTTDILFDKKTIKNDIKSRIKKKKD